MGTIPAAEHATLWLASRLLAGSVQGAFVIAIVWLACWRIRSIPASAKAALWWLASLKLLLALTSLPSIPLPVLSPDASVAVGTSVTIATDQARTLPAAVTEPLAPEPSRSRGRSLWLVGAVAVWMVAVVLHAMRLRSGLRRVRGVLARSVPVGEDDAALAARLAAAVGLRSLPGIRVSEEIDSPQVVGIFSPVVLLPAKVAGAFTPDERAMAICHELVHVRRRDLLFGWIPACSERLFFFHPLARLAAREYVLAREAACDAAVLRALGVAPRDYGRVLLRLGISGAEPSLSATAASKSRSSLKRRLDMLQDITRGQSRRWMWAAAGLLALAMVPVHLVARPAPPPPSEAASEALTGPLGGVPGDIPGDIPGGIPGGVLGGISGGVPKSSESAADVSEGQAQAPLSREFQAQVDELLAGRYALEVERFAAEIQQSAAAAAQAGQTERALRDLEKAKAEQAAGEAHLKAQLQAAFATEADAFEEFNNDVRLRAIARMKLLAERSRDAQAPAGEQRRQETEAFLQLQSQEQTNLLRELERALNQLRERQAVERTDATAEQQKRIAELSALLREMERSVRQARPDVAANADAERARGQAQQDALRRVAELQARLQAKALQDRVETDRNVPLEAQLEQLRRERESLDRQLKDLLQRRDSLLEMQKKLQADMEQIKAGIERAAPGTAAPKK